MKKRMLALGSVILLVPACADSTGRPERAVVQDPGDHKEDPADDERDDRRDDDGSRKETRDGKSSNKARPGGDGAAVDQGSDDGGSAGDDRDTTTRGSTATAQAAPYPAAGHYSFAQSGYEEFCDTAGNCEKEQLPARQPVNVTYQKRSESSAVVVSEQKASRSRRSRTWTRFTRSGASITKVHVEFDYSGFVLERTYVPRPAVEVLRFPFEAGARWSGRWEASTSGSYRVEVGSRRNVAVGKKKVAAYPVRTTTEFRGDFEGKSRITTYIDPRTKAVVATEGVLNVTSQFGRYTTVFDTRLRDGPNY